MPNDSIETLLSRHYGHMAETPGTLEQRLVASVRSEATDMLMQQSVTTHIRELRVSRRRMVQMVAISSAGLGVLESLFGQDIAQTAHP